MGAVPQLSLALPISPSANCSLCLSLFSMEKQLNAVVEVLELYPEVQGQNQVLISWKDQVVCEIGFWAQVQVLQYFDLQYSDTPNSAQ